MSPSAAGSAQLATYDVAKTFVCQKTGLAPKDLRTHVAASFAAGAAVRCGAHPEHDLKRPETILTLPKTL